MEILVFFMPKERILYRYAHIHIGSMKEKNVIACCWSVSLVGVQIVYITCI